jgi:hypothetical protein
LVAEDVQLLRGFPLYVALAGGSELAGECGASDGVRENLACEGDLQQQDG